MPIYRLNYFDKYLAFIILKNINIDSAILKLLILQKINKSITQFQLTEDGRATAHGLHVRKHVDQEQRQELLTSLLRYFVKVPSAASGPSHCPTTLIYLCPSPATSLSSGKCIQQPGACLVL